jgi:hypothetical protein
VTTYRKIPTVNLLCECIHFFIAFIDLTISTVTATFFCINIKLVKQMFDSEFEISVCARAGLVVLVY